MLIKPGEKKTAWGPSWGGRNAWRRIIKLGLVVVSVIGFAALLWPRIDTTKVPVATPSSNITISNNVKCPVDVDLLERLKVRKLKSFLRREIVAVESDADVSMSQRLDGPLLEKNKLSKADKHLIKQSENECRNPLPITVTVPPAPRTADASHIDFGVATTAGRLNDSLDAFAHWAGYTRTRIFAVLEPHEAIAELQAKADSLGINLHVKQSEEEYQRRYFSLVSHLGDNMRPQTRWSCIIDDDTFFLSMPALVKALEEYDDTQPIYLGGVSEAIPQIGAFGIMAFGGAGIFLSRPLVTELSDSSVYDSCQAMDFTGDRRLSYCVYQHSTAKLSIDHRLRQLDMMGDVSGFFESGREPPLSVHHWKSWFHADMTKVSAVSDVCGDTCLLRRWMFSDGWMLTNGYSVVKYSDEGELNLDDPTMEVSWDSHNGAVMESYLHELGPLRAKDIDKISYKLEDAVLEDGSVRQYYVLRGPEIGDQVLELTWRAE